MRKVQPGRFTASLDGDFVVFIIGMRFNKLWKVHKWLPVFTAMPKMLAELGRHPEKGMLGARTMISGRTVNLIQYWRSFDQLEQFAHRRGPCAQGSIRFPDLESNSPLLEQNLVRLPKP